MLGRSNFPMPHLSTDVLDGYFLRQVEQDNRLAVCVSLGACQQIKPAAVEAGNQVANQLQASAVYRFAIGVNILAPALGQAGLTR